VSFSYVINPAFVVPF